MLRGVNKNIIEITQTDNQYFEKAILFVRQGHLERDSAELESRAREYVSGVSAQMPEPAPTAGAATSTKERLNLKSLLVKGGIGAAVAAAAAMALFL